MTLLYRSSVSLLRSYDASCYFYRPKACALMRKW
jgi:hypothetical protein